MEPLKQPEVTAVIQTKEKDARKEQGSEEEEESTKIEVERDTSYSIDPHKQGRNERKTGEGTKTTRKIQGLYSFLKAIGWCNGKKSYCICFLFYSYICISLDIRHKSQSSVS